jgi:hypothetical protein
MQDGWMDGWMECGEGTLFGSIPVPGLPTVISYILTY